MDETHISRTSDASTAATRKRRSSILKSQRAPRAPLSELEFRVITPPDCAKSRRVSFSRRNGVAEFVTNEATTTWQNFYEERNKTLESSATESDNKLKPVGHLGKNIFDLQFQEVDAADLMTTEDNCRGPENTINNFADQLAALENTTTDKVQLPQNNFELSTFTDHQSKIFGDAMAVSGLGELTDRLTMNFSTVQQLDDLDEIQKDISKDMPHPNVVCEGPNDDENISEYIVVNLNTSHTGMKDDVSDMSITDTIHSSKVNVSGNVLLKDNMNKCKSRNNSDWVADKENIVLNPYVAPKESKNFAVNDEQDKVLLFDGKRLTMESNFKVNYRQTLLPNAKSDNVPQRKTIVLNVNDDLPNFVDDPSSSIAHGNYDQSINMSNLSMTQPLNANVNAKNESMLYEANTRISSDTHTSETRKSVKMKTIVYEGDRAYLSVAQTIPSNIILPETSTKRDTVVYGENADDTGNISMTEAISSNIFLPEKSSKRHTILYDEAAANISVTQAVPSSIILPEEITKRQTVFGKNADDTSIISMTQAISSNIILPEKSSKRRTILYDEEAANISVTQTLPSNIIVPEKSTNRDTIVFGKSADDTSNISMTQAISTNIILPEKSSKRRTILYDEEAANISVTQTLPSNIIVPEKSTNRDTIVFGKSADDTSNISMTQAISTNIFLPEKSSKRRTILYDEEAANISVTQTLPSNIILTEKSTKRDTIVFGKNADDTSNISMTQAISSNIILPEKSSKRRTILYDEEAANISVTQTLPSNIFLPEKFTKRDTIVFGENADDTANISMAQAIFSNIILPEKSSKRRTISYDEEAANISVSQLSSNIILPEKSTKRQTLVYGGNVDDTANISMTQPISSNIKSIVKRIGGAHKSIIQATDLIMPASEDELALDQNISVHQNMSKSALIAENKQNYLENFKNSARVIKGKSVHESNEGHTELTHAVPNSIYKCFAQKEIETVVKKKLYNNQILHSKNSHNDTPTIKESEKRLFAGDEENNHNVMPIEPVEIQKLQILDSEKEIQILDNTSDMDGDNAVTESIMKVKIHTKKSSKSVATQNKTVNYPADEEPSHKNQTFIYEDGKGNLSITQILPESPTITRNKIDTTIFESGSSIIRVTKIVPALQNNIDSYDSRKVLFDNERSDINVTYAAQVPAWRSSDKVDRICNVTIVDSQVDAASLLGSSTDTLVKSNDESVIVSHKDVAHPNATPVLSSSAEDKLVINNVFEKSKSTKRHISTPTVYDSASHRSSNETVVDIQVDETDLKFDKNIMSKLNSLLSNLSKNYKEHETSNLSFAKSINAMLLVKNSQSVSTDPCSVQKTSSSSSSGQISVDISSDAEVDAATEARLATRNSILADVLQIPYNIDQGLLDVSKSKNIYNSLTSDHSSSEWTDETNDVLAIKNKLLQTYNNRKTSANVRTKTDLHTKTQKHADLSDLHTIQDPDNANNLLDMLTRYADSSANWKENKINVAQAASEGVDTSNTSTDEEESRRHICIKEVVKTLRFDEELEKSSITDEADDAEKSIKTITEGDTVLTFDQDNPLNNIYIPFPVAVKPAHSYHPITENSFTTNKIPISNEIKDGIKKWFHHLKPQSSKMSASEEPFLRTPLQNDNVTVVKDTMVNTDIAMKSNHELLSDMQVLKFQPTKSRQVSSGSHKLSKILKNLQKQKAVFQKRLNDKLNLESTKKSNNDCDVINVSQRNYNCLLNNSLPLRLSPECYSLRQDERSFTNKRNLNQTESNDISASPKPVTKARKLGPINDRRESPMKFNKEGLVTHSLGDLSIRKVEGKEMVEMESSRVTKEVNTEVIMRDCIDSKDITNEVDLLGKESLTFANISQETVVQPGEAQEVLAEKARINIVQSTNWGNRSQTKVTKEILTVPMLVDMLPLFGVDGECVIDSDDCMSFWLLGGRIQLAFDASPYRSNKSPVAKVSVHTAQAPKVDHISNLCIKYTHGVLKQAAQKCTPATVKDLVRHAATVITIAKHWATAMKAAKLELGVSVDYAGRVAMKVVNFPLRTVWGVTMQICQENGHPPVARDVKGTIVAGNVDLPNSELIAATYGVREDWGHAPRIIWRIFKYMKSKRLSQ